MAASGIKGVIRGDTHTITLNVRGVSGPLNLTDSTVLFTVNKSKAPADDTSAVIMKTVTVHDDPTNGLTIIKLAPEDTKDIEPGNYWYDIQIKASNGDISSLPKARFEVVSDITRRSA